MAPNDRTNSDVYHRHSHDQWETTTQQHNQCEQKHKEHNDEINKNMDSITRRRSRLTNRHIDRLTNCPQGLASSVVRWSGMLTFILVSLVLSSQSSGVAGLSCGPCENYLCPNTTDCPGGLVMDICYCCHVCAHVENQTCGGMWGILGRCDTDLVCVIPHTPGTEIRENEEGICKRIPELRCNETECPSRVYEDRSTLCPPDSFLVSSGDTSSSGSGSSSSGNSNSFINDNENSEEVVSDVDTGNSNLLVAEGAASYCVCNISLCSIPTCASGYELHLVQNATGLPGTCCDVYQCKKPDACQLVMCPPYVENLCPADSILNAPLWTEDGCCELQQGCTCPPQEECPPVECPVGFQVQVISRASRLPGSCCDKFRCVNESGLTCSYNGKELQNGETWNIDKCKTCVCRDGLNRCKAKSCNNLSCTWMVKPEGECCPVCRGCVSDSGELYNNSAVWQEDDCTTCTCKDGHAQCQSELCEVHCDNPRKVPGQCCPVCPEPCHLDCQFGLKKDSEGNEMCECAGAEDSCPPFEEDSCEKKCEYGYKRNRDGCVKCKCNKCPQFNCTKRCLHGHILNDEGCALCKCKELPVPELITSNLEPEDLPGKACMSRYGSRHENGESWNDGCRMCYCHKGVEMCSLIACPTPHCLNPVFRVGDCCPSCPGLTIVSPNGQKELCQSSMGHYYVEGETWQMDQCTQCVCHGGAILCETETCPPVLCHHPVRHENQCCAVCRGEEGLIPTSPYHHHCKSTTGMHYKHGEIWHSTPCQSCTCQDGQIHCYNQMCPLVNCNKTVFRKGQCCPTCVDMSKPKLCSYNGVSYDKGEKWKGDNCTQCMCADGKTECFPIECPALQCSILIKKKGECCLECYDVSMIQGQELAGVTLNSRLTNSTVGPSADHESSSSTGTVVGFSILGVIIVIFAVIIVVLVFCLLKKSQKTNFKMRPKSTNVELQGHMPFLPDSQPKNVNNEKQYLEKLCPAIASEKGKGDRASNHYTEMVFGEQNKETMANGHFLALKT